MPAKDLLLQLYKKFYDQRSVLSNAPKLTIDATQVSVDNFDENLANTEISALVSYLLGIQDVQKLSWKEALALVEKYYANQAEWQKLLLDYFSYNLEKEKENITKEQTTFFQDILKELESKKPQSEEVKY